VEPWSVVKDSRRAEIAWLTLLAIVVAAGGNIVLGLLATHRIFAALLLAAVAALALNALRVAASSRGPAVRVEITKAATYFTAAALAFVAIGLHVHWAIGATIAAAEAALVFDIITIVARPAAAGGK
jgi:hypothetical protein